jgi:hypothetical protein
MATGEFHSCDIGRLKIRDVLIFSIQSTKYFKLYCIKEDEKKNVSENRQLFLKWIGSYSFNLTYSSCIFMDT